jgi:hypothetical protein
MQISNAFLLQGLPCVPLLLHLQLQVRHLFIGSAETNITVEMKL